MPEGQVSEMQIADDQVSVMPNASGQASEGQTDGGLMCPKRNTADLVSGGLVPPSTRKVIHSVEDLYDADGNPDEF